MARFLLDHVFLFFSLINIVLQLHNVKGCNVTLWPRVRFQHRFGAGPCFFRLPNRPGSPQMDQRHWWIEIAFSSFQMGRSVLNQTCPTGHVKFVEQTGVAASSSGTFCGRLSGDSQTYLTSAKALTLYSNPMSEADHFNAYFDVLSTEALRKRYPEILRANSLASDDETHGRQCDTLIRNCPNICRLSSPLHPVSAYPRNVTCHYRVLFDRDDWQVVLGGQPGDRYDLGLHHPHQQHCHDNTDRLVIYEKLIGHQQYQQVAKFCGRGTFPKIIAQSGQVMVELISSPTGFFHQGFRLSVTHQRRRKSDHQSIVSPCYHSITASGQFYQQGTITSPRHWFPRNVDCTWSLTSSRIWLEIQSKSNKLSSSSWATSSGHYNNATCFHRLLVHRTSSDPAERMTICEHNSTSSSTPTRTLLVRDQVQLRFFSQRGSMTGSDMDFSLFYMLLPEEVPVVVDTLCDRILEEPKGTIDLIGDRLLLMRHKQLKCRYRFQAPYGDDYRIRIVIRQMVFDPIRQCDPGRRDECSIDSNRQDFDWLLVSDRDLLHCFCQSAGKNQEPTIIDSASNRLDIQLDLKHIYDQSYKDTNIYRFQIDYSWIEDSGCGNPIEDDQGGMIRWRADPKGSNQSCTWLIEVPDNDRILLKINMAFAGNSSDHCHRNHHVSFGYHGRKNDSQQRQQRLRQVVTMENYGKDECSMNGEFISPFGLRYLHVQMETKSANNPRARFLLKWNVLFNSVSSLSSQESSSGVTSADNEVAPGGGMLLLPLFPCPDSNWSIPESLVCDGRINCPQQSLFGYLLDEESCTLRNSSYNQDYYYPWVMVLVVSFGFSVVISLASVSSHVRKWKSPITSAVE
ncbi:uncharacterized protein LOC123473722 isoform X2 [Daphnia magna]|uniref:uncharacterized protein LOC123473722 isoform X2 n=1 Tax=Daphnia magna TaxID=35525 RepID=UPI001E1BC95A|nr:uncharacterized protein LOC123473722 isoform X2 [Daphnia magna]